MSCPTRFASGLTGERFPKRGGDFAHKHVTLVGMLLLSGVLHACTSCSTVGPRFLSDDQLDACLVIGLAELSDSTPCEHMERCPNFDGTRVRLSLNNTASLVGQLPEDLLSAIDEIDVLPAAARFAESDHPVILIASSDIYGPGGSGTSLCGVSSEVPVVNANTGSVWVFSKDQTRLIDLVYLRALQRAYPTDARSSDGYSYRDAAVGYSVDKDKVAVVDAISRSAQRRPVRAQFSVPGEPNNEAGRSCTDP